MPRFAVHQIEPFKFTVESEEWTTVLGTFGLRESADAFAALMNRKMIDADDGRAAVIARLDGKAATVDATTTQ